MSKRKNATDDRLRQAERAGDWQKTWRELIRAGHAPGVVADGELEEKFTYSKYSGRVCRLLYEITMDGCCDEEASNEASGQWAGLLEASNEDSLEDTRQERFLAALERGDEEEGERWVVEESEQEALEAAAGAILFQRSDGFIACDLIDDPKELQEAWAETAADLDPYVEEEFLCSHHDCDTNTEEICQDCEATTCSEHLHEVEEPDHPAETLWVCGDCLSARGGTQYDSEGADA